MDETPLSLSTPRLCEEGIGVRSPPWVQEGEDGTGSGSNTPRTLWSLGTTSSSGLILPRSKETRNGL